MDDPDEVMVERLMHAAMHELPLPKAMDAERIAAAHALVARGMRWGTVADRLHINHRRMRRLMSERVA